MSVTSCKLTALFTGALLHSFPYSFVSADYPLWLALIRNKFQTMNALDIWSVSCEAASIKTKTSLPIQDKVTQSMDILYLHAPGKATILTFGRFDIVYILGARSTVIYSHTYSTKWAAYQFIGK
jgi:hypothetical protein